MQEVYHGADLILLTETHQLQQQALPDLDGYTCTSLARPPLRDTAITNRGGIAAYIKTELATDIKVWKTAPDSSYMWLTLQTRNDAVADLYICVVYVAPTSSTIYKQPNALTDPLTRLYADIAEVQNLGGHVLLAGDFNARTGEEIDYVRCEDLADVLQAPQLLGEDLPDYIQPRHNCDKSKVQGWGRQLLDMCIDTNLLILNGRVAGDEHGQLTCLANGGGSLVDYFIASPALLAQVEDLHVNTDAHVAGCKDCHSDHRPLRLRLNLDRDTPADEPMQPETQVDSVDLQCFKYDPEKVTDYCNTLAANLLTTSMQTAAGLDSIAALQHCICSTAAQVYGRKTSKVGKDHFKHQPWFDADCKADKRRLRKYLKIHPDTRVGDKMKKEYKRLLKTKRAAYEKVQADRLCHLAKVNPAAFWKCYRKRESTANNITAEGWLSAFKALVGQQFDSSGEPGQPQQEDDAGVGSANPSPCECSELNADITLAEIAEAVKKLKRNKAAGLDGIKAEFIIDAYDTLAPHLLRIFNQFLDNNFPAELSVGVIHPIFKAGDHDDPGNYRGITVGPVLAKLFAMILDQRLATWTEKNKLRAKGQAGFRKDFRTTDNLFVLKTLLDQRKARRAAKMYCCFVDFKKAFDTVPRALLWQVLRELGVEGRIMHCLQSMYAADRACVKAPGSGVTSTFTCHMGVKQGCPLSPNLFGIYIDGLEERLAAVQCDAPTLAGKAIALLLYADDLALLSESPQGLQLQLDVLAQFCAARQLTVNVKKTKVIVFEGRASACQPFTYQGDVVERVTSFRYLGIEFHSTRGFSFAIEKIMIASRKSMFALQRRCAELKIKDPATKCRLFDTLVAPVMNYACEIWAGEAAAAKLEVVHRQFLKMTAGLSSRVNSYIVLAEFGRHPMYVQQWQQALRYMHRLSDTDNERLLYNAIREQEELHREGKKCWLQSVLGWMSSLRPDHPAIQTLQAATSIPVAGMVHAARMKYQTMHTESDSSRVRTYESIRQGYRYEPYLSDFQHPQLKRTLTRFRCGDHNLQIESGRKAKSGLVPYYERRCKLCNLDAIESEDHFLTVCPALQHLRDKYQSRLPLRPTTTWVDVMRCQDCISVSKYIAECSSARQTILNHLESSNGASAP